MKNQIRFSIVLLQCLIFTYSYAQAPVFSWNVGWGNAEFDRAPNITTDPMGNVYAAGFFKGTVDFDPGPGQDTLTSWYLGFGNDSYISKFDSIGTFQWVKKIGGESNASKVLYDTSGNLYVTGDFDGTVDFDPGPGTMNITSQGNSNDTYILKLDSDGNFISVFTVGGNGQEYVGSMSMDIDGNIIVGGLFSGTSDFDPGPGQSVFTAEGNADLFIVKIDANGNFIWAKEFSGNHEGGLYGLVIDTDGNIYATGFFDDIRDFDPGPDSVIHTATGYWDIYLVKLNASGDFVWIRHLSNTGDNRATDLIIDKEQNLYVTGLFSNTLDFDPGPDTLEMTAENTDPFIWKLTSEGDLIWAVQFEGVSFDQSRDVTMDQWGNIYSTGWFGDEMDFDPGPGTHYLTSAGGNDKDDAYIAKLSTDGHFIWAYSMGGEEDDSGWNASVDLAGNVFIGGNFQGNAAFSPGDALDSLASAGSSDAFLVRWRQCPETTGEISPFACGPYTSPSGNHVWTTSGDYLDTLTNVFGCDSILTVHLTITVLNTDVTLMANASLTADQDNATYQWLDCDNGFAMIPEETNQTYFPVGSGTYAVIINYEGCTDTSACVHIDIVGVEEHEQRQAIRIYPNPANDAWYIDLEETRSSVRVEVLDSGGKLLTVWTFRDMKIIPIHSELPSGLYIIHVVSEELNAVQRLIRF